VELSAGDIIGVLDRAGLVAFAVGGVEVGFRRRFDLFGLLVMGVVAATGGGVMRDVVLNRTPLVLDRPDYILWPIVASVVAIAFLWRRRRPPRTILAVVEAAGSGAFAVAGALAAIGADLPVTAVVLLAMLTATGGGVIRDVLADRIPQVLVVEVSATAAGLGGLAVWLFEPTSPGGAAIFGMLTVATVRVAATVFAIHLPAPAMET
jgi:uncharacterized membrane protein YeiH